MPWSASPSQRGHAFLARLARDTRGNTLAMMAAALLPLLAMVGGGVDMSRAYLAESRLQQACDAGVLAARKRLGADTAKSGALPAPVETAGDRFFDVNFAEGLYGTQGRAFDMELETDYSISGVASVVVPTTIMTIFGYSQIPLSVECEARLNFSNTDVMMVLDVTGSMAQVNFGDTKSRIDALKDTVRSFYAQLADASQPGVRIRYGFVPYSTNVHVGHLLDKDWLADEWSYNYRTAKPNGKMITEPLYETKYTYVSGSNTTGAAYTSATCPSDTVSRTKLSETTDADGWTHTKYNENGASYSCEEVDADTYQVTPRTSVNHVYVSSRRQIGTKKVEDVDWYYAKFNTDVKFASKGKPTKKFKIGGSADKPKDITVGFQGCIEERATYEIGDYSNVDLDKALDLDLDLVPEKGNPATQWKPMLHELSYERQLGADSYSFTVAPASSKKDYWNAAAMGWSPCPPAAMKLAEISSSDLETYLDTLYPYGNTYHDIGMIWGGRLLSPSGIFAAENADVDGRATMRHLIFLTDGQTAPLDVSYGVYGIEPLDRRRWRPGSSLSLTKTVEKRFAFACNEVKKRNITVWVVAFGTDMNSMLSTCAGPGRHFKADNAAELEKAFSTIIKRMGDLRITK